MSNSKDEMSNSKVQMSNSKMKYTNSKYETYKCQVSQKLWKDQFILFLYRLQSMENKEKIDEKKDQPKISKMLHTSSNRGTPVSNDITKIVRQHYKPPSGNCLACPVILLSVQPCLTQTRLHSHRRLYIWPESLFSRLMGKPTMWFPNRSSTNRSVLTKNVARSLKFRI